VHFMATSALLLLAVCTQLAFAIPVGYTTYFKGNSCPAGWEPTQGAAGRLVVSVSNISLSGLVLGTPLANMEDRVHSHTISSQVYMPVKSISAIGCCNPDGACYGSYPVNGKTTSEPSGLPFVQLLLCTLTAEVDGDIPYGTLAYFSNTTIKTCEEMSGWATITTTDGRSIIPGYTTGTFASTTSPLKSLEDRPHSHTFQASFTTQDQSYAGVAGCCDKKLAEYQTYPISDVTSSVSSGLPYVQLLTCISQAPTFNVGLPSSAYIFTSVSCPPGYVISEVLAGRYLVSLPNSGVPGAVFGGPSLPQGSTIGNNHTHPFNSYFTTNSCEVGLASGCCGDGYVKNGQYVSEGITGSTDAHFPFFAVPICELAAGDKFE